MAKRSPILGYNHNVRYRGLVFHVQTEDSGVLSPHLFTHLFHLGVIVSTRKLVYDSGSAEETIKSLMQAQHKAVLKDLKRGHFDEKIDQYLGGTPGLLPRDAPEAGAEDAADARPSAPALARASQPVIEAPLPPIDAGEARAAVEPATSAKPTQQQLDPGLAFKPTERSVETRRGPFVPSPQGRQPAERKGPPPVPPPRPSRAQPAVADGAAAAVAAAPVAVEIADSGPEIEIQLELDDPDELELQRTRTARDTEAASAALDEHNRPTVDVSQLSDGVPSVDRRHDPLPPLPPMADRRSSTAVGAAALPPARPITRPPSRSAITPPQVVSRPLASDDGRRRGDSDAVEVYAPAPPSVEPPPGLAAAERPGQYSQHKRGSGQRISTDAVRGERASTAPIPPGLGRPGRTPASVPVVPPAAARPPSPGLARVPDPPVLPARQRPPTPTRASTSSGPPQSRTGTAAQAGGVVMTRPAVIVGAPAKPMTAPSRVRKAREEEGRGFGQGLISEKSLDEVILAYLSEDSEEK